MRIGLDYASIHKRAGVSLVGIAYNVLGITGFLQNIPMYESQEAALDSFGNE